MANMIKVDYNRLLQGDFFTNMEKNLANSKASIAKLSPANKNNQGVTADASMNDFRALLSTSVQILDELRTRTDKTLQNLGQQLQTDDTIGAIIMRKL